VDLFLERDIFQELIKWAKTSQKGLFLRGPRQVGKTRSLLELGHSGIFSGYLYINLRDDEIKGWWDTVRGDKSWYERFKKFYERFINYDISYGAPFLADKKLLVILDEIQESPRMFNSIRDIVREQTLKLVATGSYLGIAEFENYFSKNKQGYFYPAGDVEYLEMNAMTYREVVHACAQAGCDASKEEIFQYYFQYGGYPEVVRTWLETKNYDDCYTVLEHLYKILVRETQRYVCEPVPVSIWDRMFIGVALQIEKKKDILQDYDQELTYKFKITGDNASGRDNKISMMRWMLSCDLLWQGDVINNLKNTGNIVKQNYYFADQGIMFLALSHVGQYPTMAIDKGNISGMLAENFVALCLRDFMVPVSYAYKDDEIDFLYKNLQEGTLTAIEVKFSAGDTPSSVKAMRSGYIGHVIKIQREIEKSTAGMTVYPMLDMDIFGEFIGYPKGQTRYTKTVLNIFD